MNPHPINDSRRDFLKTMAAGGLAVAFMPSAFGADTSTAAPLSGWVQGWVHIAADGSATVFSNCSEIGQGTGTAIAQILADELDLDWRAIRLEMAPIEQRYINPQWGEYATYGSGGVAGQFAALRKAGAQARAMLIGAAASEWKVAPESCDTEAGYVVHKPSGTRASYASLATDASSLPVPDNPPLMPPERRRYIGKDIARLDLPAKVDGSAVYGVDVKLPGLLVATIFQCPQFGGRLAGVDPAPALASRGVKRIVKLDNAVAVVADSYWHAKKGLDKLKPTWDLSQASKHTSAAYDALLQAAVAAGGPVYGPKNSTPEKASAAYAEAMTKAVHSVEQTCAVPFLCHATMEPMNATARVGARDAELWLPTQTQMSTRDAVAKALGLAPEAVTLHTTLAGGGFGRRIEFDFAVQAALIAKQAGAPVKLIWSREEDMRHGYYRPAAAVRLAAGIGADGMPVALRFDSACESLFEYSGGGQYKNFAKPVDRSAIGEPPNYYSFPAILYRVSTMEAGVPVGYWRSVAASQNAFAYETFIDELARHAGIDPVAYRRKLLPEGSRERRALDAAVEHAGWQHAPTAGRHRGMALVRANRSVVVHVVELSVDREQRVKIHKVTTAIDCGVAVNPRNIRAQMEGGIAFGLSAAFHGKITLRDGAVEQSNFHDYALIRLADMPAVDVVILEGNEQPGGVGEEAVGPVTPAVANALFAATGKRITSLPLGDAGFTLA
jgi:isoquinoline 1-oxidoreductase subunit beta